MKSIEDIIKINETDNTNITEDLNAQYDALIESLQKAKEEQQPIDEGILGAIVGGIAGATVLPKIMKAICGVLGITENGQLGSLLTSKLVLAAVGTKVGMKV